MRTIVEIPENQVETLARICARDKISRTEAVRRAITLFLSAEEGPAAAADAFGLWRKHTVDALEYEDRVRDEWQVHESSPRYKRPHRLPPRR